MNCEATISVADVLDKTLHTREAAVQFLQKVIEHPCNAIELDFLNVDYMSRSFADQFHLDNLSLASLSEKTIVVVVNANEEVVRVLQVVAKTLNKSYQSSGLTVFKYSNWNQLEYFLLSI